jgi:hypothetical protein
MAVKGRGRPPLWLFVSQARPSPRDEQSGSLDNAPQVDVWGRRPRSPGPALHAFSGASEWADRSAAKRSGFPGICHTVPDSNQSGVRDRN